MGLGVWRWLSGSNHCQRDTTALTQPEQGPTQMQLDPVQAASGLGLRLAGAQEAQHHPATAWIMVPEQMVHVQGQWRWHKGKYHLG